MQLTPAEVSHLLEVMQQCRQKLLEAGAASVLILEAHEESGADWQMLWNRGGNPYACVELARRYQMLDSHRSLACTIAGEMNGGDEDAEKWKKP